MTEIKLSSEFLQYLADTPDDYDNLGHVSSIPSLTELSKELKISVSSLREQLEVAEAIGLVEVKPRIGIRRLPYSFFPAVLQSLSYAVAIEQKHFTAYADLRNHIEAAYWEEAARKLTGEDLDQLQCLLDQAWQKLRGNPIQIPHWEHRQLHMCVFVRLGNPFVIGLLEAYWEMYEAVGLNLYADYGYLQQVWNYHQQMVDAICNGDYQAGYAALVEHKDLLYHRPQAVKEFD